MSGRRYRAYQPVQTGGRFLPVPKGSKPLTKSGMEEGFIRQAETDKANAAKLAEQQNPFLHPESIVHALRSGQQPLVLNGRQHGKTRTMEAVRKLIADEAHPMPKKLHPVIPTADERLPEEKS
jgi:hypothetical protein